ncbi:ATP-binding protein [Spirillospora sp. NPDC029432]|uniref:ATP-binding protein n=1 Tax=Spirillospora sp. NPDC029432 TaxID=3154599 RepID=UPI003456AD8F
MSAEQLPDIAPWYRSPVFEEFLGSLLGELRLPNAPEAVGRARRFLRSVAAAWGVSHVTETAELCVSEVATNAYQHTDRDEERPLRLVVLRVGACIRCEVHDQSPEVPCIRDAGMLAESGRGMFILDVLTYQHGVYRTDNGKAVWFELEAWPNDEEGRS